LELNDLYYATSKLVEQNEKHLKELGANVSSIEYFRNELKKSEVLRDKIQTALYDEAKVLDEALEYVRTYKVSNEDADEDAKQSRDYSRFVEYADSMNEAQSEDRKLGNL
jgi:hypothetical protein